MEKDKIRSWRQRISFALVLHLSSADLESPCRHHPASWGSGKGQRGPWIPGRWGTCVFGYSTMFFKRGGKEFQSWLKLQMAFCLAQVINWTGINAPVCYKKRPRILIKAISQHIGKATLNSAALLMRQSQLIKNSPRAFILLQLHLQKHHVAETFCQVSAASRSFPVNGQLFSGGNAEGFLPAQEPPGWLTPACSGPQVRSPRRAAGAGEKLGFCSCCWSI